MKSVFLIGLTGLALHCSIAPDLAAHGGTYRGPSDVVPPPGGPGGSGGPGHGGGPTTPGSGGPSTPGAPARTPGGPGTGGNGPSSGGPGSTGPGTGGVDLGVDLTAWQFWWEFNKDSYIQLKRAVWQNRPVTGSDVIYMGPGSDVGVHATLRPTTRQIREILPALDRAMRSSEQQDILSASMIAMAKIGADSDGVQILDVFRERLSEANLEVRETAALAIGIAQRAEGIDDLVSLASDSVRGRKLVQRSEVSDRVRSFAVYGLGLIADATNDLGLKQKVFAALVPILIDQRASDRNLRVAAIQAIGMLRPGAGDAGDALQAAALKSLDGYWKRKLGVGDQLMQAHVPTAAAKLLDGRSSEEDMRRALREEWLNSLRDLAASRRVNPKILQSVALALGRTATRDDAAVRGALIHYSKHGKDQQARYFSLVALGRIGGDGARDALLEALRTGQKALVRPWAALALGVLGHADRRADPDAGPDPTVARALRRSFAEVKNPSTRSATAIALGLIGDTDAAQLLRGELAENRHQDEYAGYLSIALSLMNDSAAIPLLENVVERAVRRPTLLRQAATALGRLGDERAATKLAAMLDDESGNLAKLSAIAAALGFIGDSRTIQPLLRMLGDESLADLSRAFSAAALGGVGDKQELPWSSAISSHLNYRAAVETLTNGATGILDIL